MIQRQLKLRLNARQEEQCTAWLFHLTGVWNWAIRKIGLDAQDGIFYTPQAFHNLLANHGTKLGIPSHTLQGMLSTAYSAWQRCFKKLAKRPKLKGQRNKLTSIPFGKSVTSAGHAQLRGMLAYKCTASGRQYLEVPSRLSTKTCSACRSLSGPTGYAGLSVRHWMCAVCGTAHDRDVNAAMNTLYAGVGMPLERHRKVVPGIFGL